MIGSERLIIVIDTADGAAGKLKELIEFMDAPKVCACSLEEWKQELGDRRLEALFVDGQLPGSELDNLLEDVGKLDPNIPIVVTGGVLRA